MYNGVTLIYLLEKKIFLEYRMLTEVAATT